MEFDFRMLTCLPVSVISKKYNFKCKSKKKKLEEICHPEFFVWGTHIANRNYGKSRWRDHVII